MPRCCSAPAAPAHWRYARSFAREYPAVGVRGDPIYVRQGRIWTSAGVTAGIDLALDLIEAGHGVDIAQRVARELVVFLRRPGGQSQFAGPGLVATCPAGIRTRGTGPDPCRADGRPAGARAGRARRDERAASEPSVPPLARLPARRVRRTGPGRHRPAGSGVRAGAGHRLRRPSRVRVGRDDATGRCTAARRGARHYRRRFSGVPEGFPAVPGEGA